MLELKRHKWFETLLTLPSFVWLSLFFFIPSLFIFSTTFKSSDVYGNIYPGWTLDTVKTLFDPTYAVLVFRTIWLGGLTTIICLLLSIPLCYQLATSSKRFQKLLLLAIVVPFWSSFLIRIFAWKTVLHPEGFLKEFLVRVHLISEETTLLYNTASTLLVMVYTYLPFAVFPIYAQSSKFNFQLIEAAMDLGASRKEAIFKVFIPCVKTGILTATIMVFIPAIGAYVIPDLVGGVNSEMISNKIAQKTLVERNLPEAALLSTLLALIVLIPTLFITYFTIRSKKIEAEARNRE